MKRYSISEIDGGEILAEPVMTEHYQILLTEGTVLQREYIDKIKELGITEVCIWEEGEKEYKEEIDTVRLETQNKLKKQVKNVLERHIYQDNEELQQLSNTAETIIEDILNEESVVGQMIEIKNRSADIYEHSINCCALSAILGLRLGFPQDVLHAIGTGCLLHDIGLRFISVQYENTELEDMPENQRVEYKKHSVYGYSSLEKETWLNDISKKIILSHHERLDGTGYPFRSKTIADEVSVVSICDAFDEMVSGIGCKQVKVYRAIEYLKSFKNIKFNGKIVDEFLKIIAFYPVGSQVILNTGETAIVIGQNKGFPERPIVRITKRKDGTNMIRTFVRDLMQEKYVFIEQVIN